MDAVVFRKRRKIGKQPVIQSGHLVPILKDEYIINEITVEVGTLPLVQFIKGDDLVAFIIKPDFTFAELFQNVGEDAYRAVGVDLNI